MNQVVKIFLIEARFDLARKTTDAVTRVLNKYIGWSVDRTEMQRLNLIGQIVTTLFYKV